MFFALQVNAAITITPDATDPSYVIVKSIDYGSVSVGSRLQPEMAIVNPGPNDLLIGTIADVDTVMSPFSLADSCSNRTLKSGERCAVIVLYSPEFPANDAQTFNVEFPGLSQSYTVYLTATAVVRAPEPDILVSFTSVNFGSVDVGAILPAFSQVIQNRGGADLTFSSITMTGLNAADFDATENCLVKSTLIPGAYCNMGITFVPTSIGYKKATITIASDDPDENPFLIELYAHVQGENDGVPASVEDNGLNGGDGNFDGILDSLQSNIASLQATNGSYTTLMTDVNSAFRNMLVLDEASFVAPADSSVVFNYGVFDFSVEVNGAANIGMFLPTDYDVKSFYMYGPTSTDPNPHWYEFVIDAKTGFGAQIWGNAIVNEVDGATRNLVVLAIKDGGLGDSDLTANGIIRVQGAVSTVSPDDGTGALDLYVFIIAILILSLRNMSYKQAKSLIIFMEKTSDDKKN